MHKQVGVSNKYIMHKYILKVGWLCTSKLHLIKATRNINIPRSKCFWGSVYLYYIILYLFIITFSPPIFYFTKVTKKFLLAKPCLTLKIKFFHVFLNFNLKKYQNFLHLRKSLLLLLGGCFWIKIDLKF